jgi:hypothetical protein
MVRDYLTAIFTGNPGFINGSLKVAPLGVIQHPGQVTGRPVFMPGFVFPADCFKRSCGFFTHKKLALQVILVLQQSTVPDSGTGFNIQ